MEVAQLLLSLLHGWFLDEDLDHVCRSRLGLSKPKTPVCYGLLSRSGGQKFCFVFNLMNFYNFHFLLREGHMMLMLPTWPKDHRVDHFTSRGHWAISSPLTTNHLLTIVSLTNTLMSMNSAAFADGKIMRQPLPRYWRQTFT